MNSILRSLRRRETRLHTLRNWLDRETRLHTLRRGGGPQWRSPHHRRSDRYEATYRTFSCPEFFGKMDLAPPLCWEWGCLKILRIRWLQILKIQCFELPTMAIGKQNLGRIMAIGKQNLGRSNLWGSTLLKTNEAIYELRGQTQNSERISHFTSPSGASSQIAQQWQPRKENKSHKLIETIHNLCLAFL